MDECQKGENNCKSCLNMIAPLLLEEYKKARDLKDEVRDLKDEIKSLKDKNKFLEGVNEMLLEKVAR
jgi:cell division protein FtsB